MDVFALRDDQWERLEAFVPGGGKAGADRTAIIQASLVHYCEWPVQVLAGVTCWSVWVPMQRSRADTISGSKTE